MKREIIISEMRFVNRRAMIQEKELAIKFQAYKGGVSIESVWLPRTI